MTHLDDAFEVAADVVAELRPSVGFGDDGTLSIEWDHRDFSLHILLGDGRVEAYICSGGFEHEWRAG